MRTRDCGSQSQQYTDLVLYASKLPFFPNIMILWQHDCFDQELFEQRDTCCRHHTYIVIRRLYISVTTLRLTRPSVDRNKYRSRLKKLAWQLGVMSSDGHWDIFLRTLHKLVHVIANPCLLLFDQITIFEIKNWPITKFEVETYGHNSNIFLDRRWTFQETVKWKAVKVMKKL